MEHSESELLELCHHAIIRCNGKKAAINDLVRYDNVSKSAATKYVDLAMINIKKEMRSAHAIRAVVSGVIAVIAYFIAVSTGALFYIILLIAAAQFAYSLFQAIFTVGVDLGDKNLLAIIFGGKDE